jgi:hypothetical protein
LKDISIDIAFGPVAPVGFFMRWCNAAMNSFDPGGFSGARPGDGVKDVGSVP